MEEFLKDHEIGLKGRFSQINSGGHLWMNVDNIEGIRMKLEEIGLKWLHMDNNERQ